MNSERHISHSFAVTNVFKGELMVEKKLVATVEAYGGHWGRKLSFPHRSQVQFEVILVCLVYFRM